MPSSSYASNRSFAMSAAVVPAGSAIATRFQSWLPLPAYDAVICGPLISTPDSRVAVYVVPTDEELMIARHTLGCLAETRRLEKARSA